MMLSKEDLEKIAQINYILQIEGDECELELESINWLIEKLLAFDVKITELQNEQWRLREALDVLLDNPNIVKKVKMRNSK
jgi:CMP-2-keto-3-deoxyoctulosonic acid synthetase